jgi:hypothetical protein
LTAPTASPPQPPNNIHATFVFKNMHLGDGPAVKEKNHGPRITGPGLTCLLALLQFVLSSVASWGQL